MGETTCLAPVISRLHILNLSTSRPDFDPQKDYHTLYFGEILACYETD